MSRIILSLSLVILLSGCIRLAGSAGVTYPKDGEQVNKSAGFDMDSSRLVGGGNP